MNKTLTLKIEQTAEDSYTCEVDGIVMASGRTISTAIENAFSDYYEVCEMTNKEKVSRPVEELFVENYYGLDKGVNERFRINTDYGDIVNLLTMFRENILEDKSGPISNGLAMEEHPGLKEGEGNINEAMLGLGLAGLM